MRELLGQDTRLCLCALDGNARFQASDDRQGVAPAIRLGGEREWKIEIDVTAWRENGREIGFRDSAPLLPVSANDTDNDDSPDAS